MTESASRWHDSMTANAHDELRIISPSVVASAH
jgi:hypothetical protein